MAAKYPIGIQTFSEIIENHMIYVDKTALVYKIAKGTKNNFLSRPRRFGKSLLVTTLQAYFEGRKELFKGLAIEKLEKDWAKYPVIHIDLSSGKYYDISSLNAILNDILQFYEKEYGITLSDQGSFSTRLTNIIRKAKEVSGQNVVVLIDEYDAPMLDSNTNPELQDQIRNIMRDFFSPLKAQEGNLRFVFLTGITKFSQLSIFSELNNIKNISMSDEFSAICGFTKEEILDNFHEGIEELAKANKMTFDEAVAKLKEKYDGYHFSEQGPNIYNPYSLLNALYDKRFDNYWFASGTPTFLLELLQKNDMEMPDLEDIAATRDQFDTPTDNIDDPVPVLYQSGYLTIKAYDSGFYKLAYPNEEVRVGLNTSMLRYMAPKYGRQSTNFALRFRTAIVNDDIDTAMEALQTFLADFPYDVHHNKESYFQAIIYTVFITLNFTIHAEARTANGRIDLLVSTSRTIFVMELKLNQSPDKALAQIESKDYVLPYRSDGRKIFKIGINFSTEKRTIVEWKYREDKQIF